MEEKNKKGKGSTLIIILLIIIILGLVGYIYYTSTIAPKETKQEESISQSTQEGSVISNELTNELLSLIPNNDTMGYDNKDYVPYYNNKYTVDDVNKNILIYESYKRVIKNNDKVFTKDGFETGITVGVCVKLSDLNEQLKKDYNISVEGKTEEFGVPDPFELAVFYMTEEYLCLVDQEGGMAGSFVITKTDDVKYENDDIEIYTSIIFASWEWNGESFDCTISSDAEYKDVLETKNVNKVDEFETQANKENLLQKYYKQASKYKHTFKPNDDGGYYWYSTEKVE